VDSGRAGTAGDSFFLNGSGRDERIAADMISVAASSSSTLLFGGWRGGPRTGETRRAVPRDSGAVDAGRGAGMDAGRGGAGGDAGLGGKGAGASGTESNLRGRSTSVA